MVDHQGHLVQTEARGVGFRIQVHQENVRRLQSEYEMHGRRKLRGGEEDIGSLHHFRRLAESTAVATITESDAHQAYQNSVNGVVQTFTTTIDGVTYTGQLIPGVTYIASNADGCEEFGNIREEGDPNGHVYTVTCCGGGDDCEVFDPNIERRFLLTEQKYDICKPEDLVGAECTVEFRDQCQEYMTSGGDTCKAECYVDDTINNCHPLVPTEYSYDLCTPEQVDTWVCVGRHENGNCGKYQKNENSGLKYCFPACTKRRDVQPESEYFCASVPSVLLFWKTMACVSIFLASFLVIM